MENNRPLILVTNDDGYSSKGITELITMAQRIVGKVARHNFQQLYPRENHNR